MNDKKIIDYSLEVIKKWNILTMLFVIPLYLALLTIASYGTFSLGKFAIQSGNNLVKPVTSIEYYLGFPGKVFGIVYCMVILYYYLCHLKKKPY